MNVLIFVSGKFYYKWRNNRVTGGVYCLAIVLMDICWLIISCRKFRCHCLVIYSLQSDSNSKLFLISRCSIEFLFNLQAWRIFCFEYLCVYVWSKFHNFICFHIIVFLTKFTAAYSPILQTHEMTSKLHYILWRKEGNFSHQAYVPRKIDIWLGRRPSTLDMIRKNLFLLSLISRSSSRSKIAVYKLLTKLPPV